MSAKCEGVHWQAGCISAKRESSQRNIAKMQSAVAPMKSLSLWLNIAVPCRRVEPLL
jgi:hypothetical protein